ncbi:MAG: FecR family protein [Candidatus Peregrinibacteria bacterium]|nr:FecR family protein [Candidatus Peregrinibacteria bacterium]
MNYYQYQYHQRTPRRKGSDYIKPFLVIFIFLAILFFGWRLLSSQFLDKTEPLSTEKVFIEIESGSAKAMTASSGEWKNIPSSIYLYEGEKIRTLSDGRVTLSFSDDTVMRLDKGSELELLRIETTAGASRLRLKLNEGKLWSNAEGGAAQIVVEADLVSTAQTGGIFSISSPGSVYVLSGNAKTDILENGNAVKQVTVGVGQQLVVDEGLVLSLSEGLDKEVLFAVDDLFKTSNWYRWNRQKDGGVLDEKMESEANDIEDVDAPAEEETLDEPEEVVEEEVEADPNDNEPPSKPQIEKPGQNDDVVDLEDVEQMISGSVSDDTYTVIVNDYRLTQYKPGSGTFSYYAKVAYDNLEVGENVYEVIAEDKSGNQSKAAKITLVLPQEVYDEAQEDQAADSATEEASSSDSASPAPAAESSGGVTITSPNNGENLVTSETSFEIKGTVPSGTAKVLVNGYQLQAFEEGGTTFLYRANTTLKTLEIGSVNTYTVKAYGESGSLLGSATISIDVESGGAGNGDPTITMPSAEGNYSTTLDQLVIGGTIGKWVDMVYVNDVKINDYIPGSEEWKKTVTLSPGANSYTVYGMMDGSKTASVSITINYQN